MTVTELLLVSAEGATGGLPESLREANRAIRYDWTPFLGPAVRYANAATPDDLRVREDEEGFKSYHDIITLDPPPAHIRESRITLRVSVPAVCEVPAVPFLPVYRRPLRPAARHADYSA